MVFWTSKHRKQDRQSMFIYVHYETQVLVFIPCHPHLPGIALGKISPAIDANFVSSSRAAAASGVPTASGC